MKFFVNNPTEVVKDGLEGLASNPDLVLLDQFPKIKVVLRNHWKKDKVSIISGGGSGHEPAHAGFVGEGMLTAAVCGEIFASPSVDAVLSAIIATTGPHGCLLIIKNYTGDRLNFGLAAEQARDMGYQVETVVVGDDIALGKDVERRGIAGTLFVHKVAGYYAELGESLETVAHMAKIVASQIYSIGLSLEEGKKFQNPEPSRISQNKAELGLGIHGEPGIETIPLDSAAQLLNVAMEKLLPYLKIDEEARFAVLLNNLGSVTPIEMNILLKALLNHPISPNIEILVGPAPMMTSLNMIGFSLSFLKLSDDLAAALRKQVPMANWNIHQLNSPTFVSSPEIPSAFPFEASHNELVRNIVTTIAKTLINFEKEINELDEKVGDGDAGSTFALIGKNILDADEKLPYNNLGQLFTTIGRILARDTGGSSGVLLSIFFSSAGNSFKIDQEPGQSLLHGLNKMKFFGGAEVGDRTMLDALQPAIEVMEKKGTLQEIAAAARKGADQTKDILSTKYGRSSYLSEESLKGIPDPGAEIIATALEKSSFQK